MLGYARPSQTRLCRVMRVRCSLLFSAMLSYAVSRDAIRCPELCDAIFAVLCSARLHCAMICYNKLSSVVLCHAMLCDGVLCYVMLVKLCYAMLCMSCVWTDGRTDGRRREGWMDGFTADGWMAGWLAGWMDGWTEGRKQACMLRMNVCKHIYIHTTVQFSQLFISRPEPPYNVPGDPNSPRNPPSTDKPNHPQQSS